MATVVEVELTREAIAAHVNQSCLVNVRPEDLVVKHYGFDGRIGWDSYIVSDAHGVLGFTNGPLV